MVPLDPVIPRSGLFRSGKLDQRLQMQDPSVFKGVNVVQINPDFRRRGLWPRGIQPISLHFHRARHDPIPTSLPRYIYRQYALCSYNIYLSLAQFNPMGVAPRLLTFSVLTVEACST